MTHPASQARHLRTAASTCADPAERAALRAHAARLLHRYPRAIVRQIKEMTA